MVSDVDYDLTVRLRGVRRDVAERLATTAPGRGWVDLEPWIYQRTNEALADHLRLVRDEADRVADEVAAGSATRPGSCGRRPTPAGSACGAPRRARTPAWPRWRRPARPAWSSG